MGYASARKHVLASLPKNSEGAEIGVWKGNFSEAILAHAKPTRLHLIDPWATSQDPIHRTAWYGTERGQNMDAIHDLVRSRFSNQIANGQVMIHRKPSAQALAGFAPQCLDFVYIDGDHSYHAVSMDLELSFEATRTGGVICVDDHQTGRWWGDGIIRAVNECLGRHPTRLEIAFAANSQVMLRKL